MTKKNKQYLGIGLLLLFFFKDAFKPKITETIETITPVKTGKPIEEIDLNDDDDKDDIVPPGLEVDENGNLIGDGSTDNDVVDKLEDLNNRS